MKKFLFLVGFLALTGVAASEGFGLVETNERLRQDHYDATITYPQLNGSEVDRANKAIQSFARGLAQEFVQEYRRLSEEGAHQGPEWSLSIDCPEVFLGDKVLAFFFRGYDYRGGAHGLPVLAPLWLDRDSGAVLQVPDLFQNGSGYLSLLSDKTLTALSTRPNYRPDLDWLRRGTAPLEENFRVVFPRGDGLLVVFPPYQVDSYAAGPQEVLLPYSELKPVLDSDLLP